MPLVGGTPTQFAAANATAPIAANATGVYWLEGGAVMRMSIGDSAPTAFTVTTTQNLWQLALGESSVFTFRATIVPIASMQDVALVGVPLDGGTPVTLSELGMAFPLDLAVQADSVYWLTYDGLMKVGVGGGTPEILAPGFGGKIAVDADSIYWTSTSEGTVMKLTPR